MTSPSSLKELAVDLREGSLLGSFARRALQGGVTEQMAPLAVLEPGKGLEMGPAPAVNRAEIARALRVDNEERRHPQAAALADRLADPATRVVVTGQQVGLLGGPLYTFTKALAATLWARRIEAETGEAAVAVFWMATEDHDYAEVAKAHLPQLEVPQFALEDDPEPLVPMGRRLLGDGLRDVFVNWQARLEHRPDALARLGSLRSWYAPDATWGEAFAQLMIAALGEHCPLLLDAQLPRLKELQAPWHRQLIERRDAVDEALDHAHRRVEKAGLAPRTRRVAGESPLFVLDGKGARRRVCFEGDRFRLRGGQEQGSVSDLLDLLASSPERFGPGALSRALIQDALLGTSLQVLGPGEVAYMAEAALLYEVLDVQAPKIAQRPQGALVPARMVSRIEELAEGGLRPAALLGSEQRLEALLAERGGDDPVAAALPEIEELLAAVSARCLEVDAHLEKPAEKTRSAVLGALQKLRAKATASRARQNEVLAGRVASARSLLFPGAPQDRVVTAAHYFVEVDGFGEWFARHLDLDPRSLQLLALPQ